MLELRTLGALELRRAGEPVSGAIPLQTKRLVLLAYLAASAPRGFCRRDTILGLFWPELDQEHARGSLRQALHVLRKTLGDGGLLTRGESEIGLDASMLRSDAHDLEAALQAGDAVRALSLYQGDFLEGVFVADSSPELEEWIAAERMRLRRLAASAAWRASEESAGGGDVGQFVRRAVQLSGDDEEALRRGLRLLDRLGDRAGAIALYEEFARRVARELDVELSAETQAAIQALRARRPPAAGSAAPTGPSPIPLPDRVERPAPDRIVRRQPGRKLLLAGGAGALITLVLAALLGPVRSASLAPAEGLVAVVPFRVSDADSSLAWLHEGIVELLTIRLAGEGGPRVADPATVLTEWSRQVAAGGTNAPPEAALRVADQLGAERVIQGSIIGTARRVTLSARLTLVSGAVLAERVTAEGSPDSLPLLVDHLAAQLLGAQAGIEGPRLASLTSTSLPAIRAFLQGREAFRRARFEDALQHYRTATDMDSTFALAALELTRAAGWVSGNVDVARGERLARAGRDRLSPADRAVLDARTGDWASAPEMFDRLNAAVSAYPNRSETWYDLGDAHYHWGRLAGDSASLGHAVEAFRRGWLLDSTAAGASRITGTLVAEPIGHMVDIAQIQGDTAEVLRLTGQFLAVDSTSDLARVLQWHRAHVTGDAARRQVWAGIGTARQQAVGIIAQFITGSGVGTEDLRRATAEEAHRYRTHDPGYGTLLLRVRALNAGRPGDAPEPRDAGEFVARRVLRWRVFDALSWDGDTASARLAALELRQYADGQSMAGEAGRVQLYDICTLGLWSSAQGDQAAAAASSRRLRAARVSGLSPADSTVTAHHVALCSALLEAMQASAQASAVARTRIAMADSLAQALIFQVCCGDGVKNANLILAGLWERAGDLPRALAAARRRPIGFGVTQPYLSSHLREEGRLAALTGDTAGAVRAYRHYLALRPDPEPAVRPAVDQVRQALAALQARTPTVNPASAP